MTHLPAIILECFGHGEVLNLSRIAARTGLNRRQIAVVLARLVKRKRLWHLGYDQYSLEDAPESLYGDQNKVLEAVNALPAPSRHWVTTAFLRKATGLDAERCLKALHGLVARQKMCQRKRGVYGCWA